jgi:hypothetical protein
MAQPAPAPGAPPEKPAREQAELEAWAPVSFGTYMAPKGEFWRSDGGYDVIVHFHLGTMAERDFRATGIDAVVVSATFGVYSTPYFAALERPERFAEMLDEVSRALAQKTGQPDLHPRRVALFGWSAGYAAISQILQHGRYADLIDGIVILDGLHTDYAKGELAVTSRPRRVDEQQLEPFVVYAREALAGRRLMVITHSEIVPPNYASTTETANALIGTLRVPPEYTEEPEEGGMTLRVRAEKRDFHVLGYKGEAAQDHIKQLHLVERVVRDYVKPRWLRTR